ncbi:hypothetical protein C450_19506 [Halococcus salifodinae DSM 8989]|uniref:Uncharacterized protein n=1 Tax=Halococcus salifodinae DSM 8989 TaxID=1227456 RepID=M0MW15_9EURY|nr:hypothetical protein C450_19506 [Halococcus salifodinae DSM 8989]
MGERYRCLFEDGENADVGVVVTLAFCPRAVFVEESFDALGRSVGC